MLAILKNYNSFANSDEDAIVLCNDKTVVQIQSYKEVIRLSDLILKLFTEYIRHENVCLGLLFDYNVCIPSIILSLLKLKHAFVFLTLKRLDKPITDLKLNWILSLGDVREIENYTEVHKLTFNCNKLILWGRDLKFPHISYRDIFCIVQTSGSTGESKIIKVPHGCIEANITALSKLFKINSKDVIYWGTPLTFDPSLIELLLALQSGATLLIVPYNVSINPFSLYKALFNVKKVTILQMVPSIFLRWHENQIKDILSNSRLRILAFGGEQFPKCILGNERSSNLGIFNLYGITEVSCWATIYKIKGETCYDEISIGETLEETLVELRDKDGKTVCCGEGEIFIGSSSRFCVLNDEKLNEICKPVFRGTGDIAKVNERGIFLIGRKNKIVKRFGHRINLAKMESVITEGTGLETRCVWSSENSKILTFLLIKNLDPTVKKKIKDKLRVKLISILSEETFPDFIEIVENFPLTSHGKLDEKALQRLHFVPKTDLSIVDTFSNLWRKYFGINEEQFEKIKRYTFLEMGGSSITALQFIREFEEVANVECPDEIYRNVFEKSLEDSLNYLSVFRPKRKINSERVDGVRKKIATTHNVLNILWSYDLKACVDCSPLVFEKGGSMYVCVGSFSNIFTVLNEKGESVYEVILPGTIEGKPTVLPDANILVGCFNGIMYCIDFVKKDVKWQYATSGNIKSSACYCRGQSTVIFGSYDRNVHCVSAESGTPLWTTLLEGSIASNPIHDETIKKIFTATTAGTSFCLSEETGDILWKYDCGGPIFGTPCFVNSRQGVVFPVVQGILYCLSSNGGLLWKFQADGHIFSSLLSHENRLVFGCHDKCIYIAKLGSSGCYATDKVALESEVSSTPLVCDVDGKTVIVAACNSGIIYVIDFETCSIMCSLALPNQVFSSASMYNNRIYVGCRDNNLYCIDVGVKQ